MRIYLCAVYVKKRIIKLHVDNKNYESMAKFGQIEKFQPDNELFSTYIECLELFIEANDVSEEKRLPVLTITELWTRIAYACPVNCSFGDTFGHLIVL